MKDAGVTTEQLDWLVLHQANQRILDAAAQRLSIPSDRVVSNLEEYGNTSAASIPLAFDEAVRGGKIKSGDTVSAFRCYASKHTHQEQTQLWQAHAQGVQNKSWLVWPTAVHAACLMDVTLMAKQCDRCRPGGRMVPVCMHMFQATSCWLNGAAPPSC